MLNNDILRDARGNTASIKFFGSREAAQKALDSLKNCDDCRNCSGCSDCSRCSGCSGCFRCSGCSGCSRCSGCSGCSDCSGCSGCSDCSGKKGNTGDFVPPPIPQIENIHTRVAEAALAPQALDMSDWHTCSTTHCRSGWAIHLAGEPGYALERFHGPMLAGLLIYRDSSPIKVSPVRFFETNDQARTDMLRCAAEEAALAAAPAQTVDDGGER